MDCLSRAGELALPIEAGPLKLLLAALLYRSSSIVPLLMPGDFGDDIFYNLLFLLNAGV